MSQVVYVASPESQQIHVFKLTENGALTQLQVVDVPGQVQPMTLAPNKKFLYVGVRPEFRVITYGIGNDGTLTELGHASLTGSPTHISTDHAGKFLFSASYSFNCTSISPILENGVVGEPIQNIEGLQAPHSANMDLSNKTLMIPALKEDHIRLFSLNDSGNATELNTQIEMKAGAGPRHMAFHANQQAAYCINELDSTLDVIKLDVSAQQFERIQTISAVPEDFVQTCWSSDIHITPNNKFLYCSERTSSILTCFEVAEDGLKTKIVGFYKTEEQPRGFAIDHTGQYLIAAGQKSHHISVHKIDSETGVLSDVARYAVGQGCMWVTILKMD